MQAESTWTPPSGTLGAIVAEAAARADALRVRRAELERAAEGAPPVGSLAVALRREDVAVLAEVKRRSPSKGAINEGLCAPAQARLYAQGGAAGVSVLTEPAHFGGAAEDLVAVGQAVGIPLLKKDFHVDEVQLLEARALGASAVLLIARALRPDRLLAMTREAHALGLEVLIEVRDERELETALATDARMVGVNNRNLETLVIDPATSRRMIPAIPRDRVAIAESGMASRAAVAAAASAGADAVLIGSVLSGAADPVSLLRSFTGVPRGARD